MRTLKKLYHSNKGMTLVEVLIAAAILGVLSLILFMGIGAMTGIALQSEDLKRAHALLSERIISGGSEDVSVEYMPGVIAIEGVDIHGKYATYKTEDGEQFTVFEAGEAGD